jgi:hypothetical protein
MTEDDEAWGRDFVAGAIRGKPVKGCIVLHLGSDDTGKRWPGNSAKTILSLAVERGYHCFLFDTLGIVEGFFLDGITEIGNMGANHVMAVICACDVLLCVDNPTFKMGEYFKKKVIPLFGFVPSHDFAKKSKCYSNTIVNEKDIFFAIESWIDTSTGCNCSISLGDIKTFEI